jgi:hypothetical protein
MEDAWTVIVEPLPREAAERALAAWLQQQAEQGVIYNADELRKDTVLSKDSRTLIQFAVLTPTP